MKFTIKTFLLIGLLSSGLSSLGSAEMEDPQLPSLPPDFTSIETGQSPGISEEGLNKLRRLILRASQNAPFLTLQHFINLGFSEDEYHMIKTFGARLTPEVEKQLIELAKADVLYVPTFRMGTLTVDFQREQQLANLFSKEKVEKIKAENDSQKLFLQTEIQQAKLKLSHIRTLLKAKNCQASQIIWEMDQLIDALQSKEE